MKSLLLTVALFVQRATLASAKDPSTYFGGSDNEGYLAWLQTASYDKSSFLESTKQAGSGVALHWTIDGDTIKLGVAAKATGWVGFGIGESGSMLGADIVMFSADDNALVDSYVLEKSVTPLRDDCQSWTLIDSTIEEGLIIFEASRPLNTGDTQDRIIADDSDLVVPATRVLAAWGDSTEPSYHGDSTARSAIRFFGSVSASDEVESFQVDMAREAEGNFTVRANNYIIPTNRTTYAHFCLSRDEILAMNVDLDQDFHTIGIEPFIDSRTTQFVHHYVLKASSMHWNASENCDEYPGNEIAYIWAPGDVPLNLPANIGAPFGSNGFQSFQLQIHYDNPNGTPNQIDDSGIRMFYTSKKREFDMGIFATGDPSIGIGDGLVSPNGGLSQHVFDCPSSCSGNVTTQPVTVIREHLHMHAVGASMFNAQIRNGEVIRQGEVQYWDFNQQGNIAVAQPSFTIEPGDAFRTVCNYDANNNETWGLGSDNEMCMAFLYYYPRQVMSTEYGEIPFTCGVKVSDFLPPCEAEYTATPDFAESRQLGRVFGAVGDDASCGVPNAAPNAAPSGGTDSSSAATGITLLAYLSSLVVMSSSFLWLCL